MAIDLPRTSVREVSETYIGTVEVLIPEVPVNMESRDAQLAPVRAGCNTISDSRNQPSGNKLTRPISAGLNDGSNDHNYTGPKD